MFLINLLSGRCNYSFINKPLSTNRKYYKECEVTARYCQKCDKPKSLRLFTKNSLICNICCNRAAIHTRGGNLGNQIAIDEIDFSHKYDLLYALRDTEGPIRQRVMDVQDERQGIKYYIQVTVGVRRDTSIGENRQEMTFYSNPTVYIEGTNLEQDIAYAFQDLFRKFEKYTNQHSGWVLEEVRSILLHSITYQPTSGSS